MNRRAAILLALGGICFVTLMLHYFESARLFKDKSKISEPKIVNETTIDDVLILVFTGQGTRARLKAIMETWLRHLPLTSFMVYTDEDNTVLPNIVNVGGANEGHQMTTKVPRGFRDAYKRYPHKRWFYKVDDDTFVVVRNLVKTLNRYDWQHAQYIGHRMNINGFVDCNGGAGYAISQGVMRTFMNETSPDSSDYYRCMTHECGRNAEDQCMAICMRKYFSRDCENNYGFNMYETDQKSRAPDCVHQCISLHHVFGSKVYTWYEQLYTNYDAGLGINTIINTFNTTTM